MERAVIPLCGLRLELCLQLCRLGTRLGVRPETRGGASGGNRVNALQQARVFLQFAAQGRTAREDRLTRRLRSDQSYEALTGMPLCLGSQRNDRFLPRRHALRRQAGSVDRRTRKPRRSRGHRPVDGAAKRRRAPCGPGSRSLPEGAASRVVFPETRSGRIQAAASGRAEYAAADTLSLFGVRRSRRTDAYIARWRACTRSARPEREGARTTLCAVPWHTSF